jgi:hypothetical protein
MAKSRARNDLRRRQKTEHGEEVQNIYATFLCAIFISETLITAADDGHLYIWEHARIVRRVAAHEGSILALTVHE